MGTDRRGSGTCLRAACAGVPGRAGRERKGFDTGNAARLTACSLCRHCRYNTQRLTELILQFYGIRADMKRECKHARISMKVSLTVEN